MYQAKRFFPGNTSPQNPECTGWLFSAGMSLLSWIGNQSNLSSSSIWTLGSTRHNVIDMEQQNFWRAFFVYIHSVKVSRLPGIYQEMLCVLNGKAIETMETCSEHLLTRKTPSLVAVTLAWRVGELMVLCCSPPYITFHNQAVTLLLEASFLSKVALDFHLHDDISLPVFFWILKINRRDVSTP